MPRKSSSITVTDLFCGAGGSSLGASWTGVEIALAMNRHAGHAKYVTIEEPENHLSHTSLATLLDRSHAIQHLFCDVNTA